MFRLIKWILLLGILPAGWGCIKFLTLLSPSIYLSNYFIYVFGASLFLRFLINTINNKKISSLITFAQTMEHELTHTIVGILMLVPPKQFVATESDGGYVQLQHNDLNFASSFRNFAITIAPYVLPLWTLIFFSISLIATKPYSDYFAYISIFIWSNFLFRLKYEIHKDQTDLQELGFIFSLFCILLSLVAQCTFIINYFYGQSYNDLLKQITSSYIDVFKLVQNWM